MKQEDMDEKVRHTFQRFHSQREETNHTLETKSASRVKPCEDFDMHLLFPIHHTVRSLISEFRLALKINGYKCIEMGEKQLLIIRINFADRLRKLFMCRQPPKFIISVNTHEFLSVRTVSIKPLRSNSNFSYRQSKPNELRDEIEKIAKLLQSLPSLNTAEEGDINELDSEYKQDFYSLDATSYYMYSRMLVDSNYTLGQKMEDVIFKFRRHPKLELVSREDLQWLHEALNEISDELLQGFNCSRKELLEILSYCRKSVEQYFHNNHKQYHANEGEDQYFYSEGFPAEVKEIAKFMPDTLKQLTKLEKSTTSMDIIKSMFMIGTIFQAECEVKSIDEQTAHRCIELIRTSFSGTINDKAKLLKSSGYCEANYDCFIGKFNFDHEVTF